MTPQVCFIRSRAGKAGGSTSRASAARSAARVSRATRNQGTIQNIPMIPGRTNADFQPKCDAVYTTIGGASTEPSRYPLLNKPSATPRLAGGMVCPIAFNPPG